MDIFERMQRLTLNTKTSSTSGQPVSAGTATVKGVDANEFREVKTPKLTEKIRDFRGDVDRLNDTRLFLEKQFTPPELNETVQPSNAKNLKLTDKYKAILNYLRSNGARTLKQIADSRRLGLPETREILKDLIERELVELDDDVYRLPTK